MYSQELLIYTITTDATKLQQFVSEKYWIVMSSNGLVINDKETRYLAENDVSQYDVISLVLSAQILKTTL